MLRACFGQSFRVARSLHRPNGIGLAPALWSGATSRGKSNTSHSTEESVVDWRYVAAGLAAGAAGVLLWSSEENIKAKCGSSDNWKYIPPGTRKPSSLSETPVLPDSTPELQDKSVLVHQSEPVLLEEKEEVKPVDPTLLPSHVPYLIIGAGTAAMSAYRAIRTKDVNAKVLLVGEEDYKPYMRPPLSKDLWFTTDKSLTSRLIFNTWAGKERSIFFENDQYFCLPGELVTNDKGGVAVATGKKVVNLDTKKKQVTLSDGSVISYQKCLIATGGRPRNLPSLASAGPEVMEKVTLFRNIEDYRRLDAVTDSAKSVLVIGGGFLGSELACALGKKSLSNGMRVIQVFPEAGNMARVLPAYLSHWTTNKVRKENVDVIPNVLVDSIRLSEAGNLLEVVLNSGDILSAEHLVVAVGLEANTDLADAAGLEVDSGHGGYLVNSELEAATDVWVAGDAACFYDTRLGRRRVEHHDNAVVSGRIAGENMTGAAKRLTHQSMFWSDLGPEVGYEAIGLVDSSLPTVSVFAKASKADTPISTELATGESLRSETEQEKPASLTSQSGDGENYGKGVIFYLKGRRVVGVVCWNVFNKIGIARKIINEGAEHEDLTEVAKLFDLHPPTQEQSAAN